MIVQEHDQGIDFSFRGQLDIFTIAVDQKELLRRARALWGEDPDARKALDVLDFPSQCIRGEVTRHLAGQLETMLKWPSDLLSGEAARGLENSVLDMILGAVEIRSRPQEQHGATGRRASLRNNIGKEVTCQRWAFCHRVR